MGHFMVTHVMTPVISYPCNSPCHLPLKNVLLSLTSDVISTTLLTLSPILYSLPSIVNTPLQWPIYSTHSHLYYYSLHHLYSILLNDTPWLIPYTIIITQHDFHSTLHLFNKSLYSSSHQLYMSLHFINFTCQFIPLSIFPHSLLTHLYSILLILYTQWLLHLDNTPIIHHSTTQWLFIIDNLSICKHCE